MPEMGNRAEGHCPSKSGIRRVLGEEEDVQKPWPRPAADRDSALLANLVATGDAGGAAAPPIIAVGAGAFSRGSKRQ